MFYVATGNLYHQSHFCILTTQWKFYTPLATQNNIAQTAEQIISLLNDGLTDQEEGKIIEICSIFAQDKKLETLFQYLLNKKFEQRNALELIILRFDEAMPQNALSVEFLWKATLATFIGFPPPTFDKQPENKHILTTLLVNACLDSSVKVSTFQKILAYNAHAWAWHGKDTDKGRYIFTKQYDFETICLTEIMLIYCAEKMLQNPQHTNKKIAWFVYQSLEKPLCNRRKQQQTKIDNQRKQLKIQIGTK